MIKLKDISVKKRLLFILVIWVLISIGLGTFTISQMNILGNETRFMYEHPLQVSNAAIDARVNVIKIQKLIRDCALAENEKEAEQNIELMKSLDRKIVEDLNTIKNQVVTESSKALEEQIRRSYFNWKRGREETIALIKAGKPEEAIRGMKNKYASIVDALECMLQQLENNSQLKADEHIRELKNLEFRQKQIIAGSIILLGIIFLVIFSIVIKSILTPIQNLVQAMDESMATGGLVCVDDSGNDELSNLSRFYNRTVKMLFSMFWIKDNKNRLNEKLFEHQTAEELARTAINCLCRTVSGGRGVFYIYEKENKVLSLAASYAFNQADKLAGKLALGEGIVGQAALEKRAMLLKDIKDEKSMINTSITSQRPVNSYVLPLIYKEELYGVIEIASAEKFDDKKLEYLDEVNTSIAVSLCSALQSAKIVELLKVSEEAREEVVYKAHELEKINTLLCSQQEMLQQQAEELLQTNAELEEQQQQLQQQSEELQQTNSQLEEQQQQLEQQAVLLNEQNMKLEEAKSELELSNKYKLDFLANMSHELRTPLNSIILLSKLILNKNKEGLSESDKEKIHIIHNSGQELLRLINDILDLSKIEAGRVNVENIYFDSSEIAVEMQNMFEGMAKEKNLKLIIKDNIGKKLYGDRYKVSQILRNFVSNAIKFTAHGSVTIKINQNIDSLNGVIFSVRDTGIGIPKEQQKIIFEEFRQGDGSISRKYGGTGLGLSISKHLSEMLGGSIKLLSEVGAGSEFILYIPELIVKEYVNLSDNKAILVIEDDKTFSEYVQQVVHKMGFDTLIAENGKTGLELAKRYKPQGILLDLGLPDIHGMDVLRELKSIKELRNIPVHIISVYDRSNKPQRLGAVGYNQKPVAEGEMIKLISRMVNITEKKAKKVLFVEQSEEKRDYITGLLHGLDVEVHGVDTESEAKEKITKEKYDLIILDVELKEGNGFNVCKFAGQNKTDTPIVIYTGKELTPEQEKEIRKVADRIILKIANSEERLLDEATLFLHTVKEGSYANKEKLERIKWQHELSLDGKAILIVDDDPRNVYTLASVLEDCKADIIEAHNGEAALNMIKQKKIDLILMDIMMPGMDGYEAIEQIKKDKNFKHIPIIALTAKSLKGDRDKCIAAGADDYISKPIDYDNLIRVIKAWISKN